MKARKKRQSKNHEREDNREEAKASSAMMTWEAGLQISEARY